MQLPDFSLNGRVALVTGATRGLGLAMATAYAAGGARVVINGRDPAHVDQAVRRITDAGGQADGLVHDLSDVDGLEPAYRALCERVGVPDVLVNNVGQRIRLPLAEFSLAQMRALLEVDLLAAAELSRLAAQGMCKAGRGGRLITVTSIAGQLARAGDAVYPIAKHGLVGLVRALAVEYGPDGITSNGIAPGSFETESNEQLLQDTARAQAMTARCPLGRWGRPEEIAGAAVFLASPAASYVNGHVLVVDGGHTAAF